MNTVRDRGVFCAALRCGSFDQLQQQLALLQTAIPKKYSMEPFRDVPHFSDGVNYWCATPSPGTRFKKNIVGFSRAQLFYWSEHQSSSFFRHALDVLLNFSLNEFEEVSLRFCTDCSYQLLRTPEAGYLTVRPYVRLPRAKRADVNQPYIPAMLALAKGFENEITFKLEYANGEHEETLFASGAELVSAVSRRPVLCLSNRPLVAWEKMRNIFGPGLLQAIEPMDKGSFEFSFMTTTDQCQVRFEQLSKGLSDRFERTFVTYGFEKGFDPLVGLSEAKVSTETVSRFPLLHRTILASSSDIELQVDGLLDTEGTYGLELLCSNRKRFDELLSSTALPWLLSDCVTGRWKVLP